MDPELELLRKEQEIRALPAQFKNDKEGFEKALTEKTAELRSIKQKIDQAKAPSAPRSEEDADKYWSDLQTALNEKRAITMNGAQAVQMINEIFSANQLLSKLLPFVSKFEGAYGSTIVPVMNPSLALPAATSEGNASISADATAVYGVKTLTLKPWYSILSVSRGLDRGLSLDSFRSKMLPVFQKAFLSAIDRGILIGDGQTNNPLGLFVASSSGVPSSVDINCAAAGAPKLVDLLGMASVLKGYAPDEALGIVLNPAFIGAMLAESSSSYEAIKNEILTRGTIRGVKILESGHAPSTTTAGSYVAVGGPLKDYGWAYGLGMEIVPIEKSGSDNVDYNAFMYQMGAPLVGANFRRLATISGS